MLCVPGTCSCYEFYSLPSPVILPMEWAWQGVYNFSIPRLARPVGHPRASYSVRLIYTSPEPNHTRACAERTGNMLIS